MMTLSSSDGGGGSGQEGGGEGGRDRRATLAAAALARFQKVPCQNDGEGGAGVGGEKRDV